VRALVDQARYCRQSHRNHLHLVRRLASAAENVRLG
jgi:hypothetical protein